MKKGNLWKLAAILACATTLVATGCTGCKSSKDMDASEIKEKVRAFYGENKEITDGNYDQSLAVKCSGGTFVGKLADSTIVFRGIPYVAGQSPDGKAKEWPLYDLENKQVMVFDEFNIHTEKESQRKIVDWDRTYPLTKYYGF